VLQFSRLIAAGLVDFQMKANNSWLLVTYSVRLTPKGQMLIEAWKAGDRIRLQTVLGDPTGDADVSLGHTAGAG
jgi:hypothetical protein